MTQEDKSEEYILMGIQTFPFAIIFALLFGFAVNTRILLSIPFILIGYGVIILPILDLAGMHRLNTISTIVYALLTALYITLVAVLLEYYNMQWIVLYTALGMVSVIAASGYAYIRLTKDTPPICQGIGQAN
jgi:hypothetical protein